MITKEELLKAAFIEAYKQDLAEGKEVPVFDTPIDEEMQQRVKKNLKENDG